MLRAFFVLAGKKSKTMSVSQLSEQPGKLESLIQPCPYQADPLAVFQQLCQGQSHSLLLESAEIDSKDNLKSLLLIDSALKLTCQGNQVTCLALSDNGRSLLPLLASCHLPGVTSERQSDSLTLTFSAPAANLDEASRLVAPSVFDGIRQLLQQIDCLRDHPQALFLGGVFAYDLLASAEHLPPVPVGDNSCPDYVFYLAESLLLFDHQQQTCELLGSVFSGPNVANSYFSVSKRLEAIRNQLDTPLRVKKDLTQKVTNEQLQLSKSDAQYCQDVSQLKENILAGDIFQVVPSRTFSLPCPSPYLAYQALKQQNPSPYMFFLQDADFCMFGASPESALKYQASNNQVELYPIAGTRPRGKSTDGHLDVDLDSRIELELRQDEKEGAEHLMLVDLARNDLARICQTGSRYVKDLLKVDRYSHVMHLVSRVVGQLNPGLDALHAYQACMNMGTLVGAPKISAARLIRKVEQQRRGSYGGAVGYVNGQGDMDTCIVIRSAFVKNGTAQVQAGAGVVHDSIPQNEADETRNKAQAVISAILSAHAPNPIEQAKEH